MIELTRDAQAIIDGARGSDEPTADDRKRVRAAVFAGLGIPGGGATAHAATGVDQAASAAVGKTTGSVQALNSATVATTGASAIGLKVVLGLVLAGGLGLGGYLVFRGGAPDDPAGGRTGPGVAAIEAPPTPTIEPEPEPAPPPIAVPDPDSDHAIAEPSPDQHKKTTRPTHKRARTTRPEPRPAADPIEALERENKLLRGAKRALDAGKPIIAMSLLGKHASEFPRGQLAQEREGWRVIVYCELGETDRAKRTAARFLARWPRHPMAARVRDSCAR